ncbi:hypothetical protein D1007_19052 [Hordeum vulgare]|nr:hypothetical protein D1007_19052 [Hordeum vulgare]
MNAEWKADIDRRVVVTANRRNMLNMKRARDEAAGQEEASHAAGMANIPPHHQQVGQYLQGTWGSQQSVPSPTDLLPPLWGYAPLVEYVNGDVLSSFNPNITFPHGSVPPALNLDPCTPSHVSTAGFSTQYSYSSPAYCLACAHSRSWSPILRTWLGATIQQHRH